MAAADLLSAEDAALVRHDAWLVQRWLSIEQQGIAIAQVAPHALHVATQRHAGALHVRRLALAAGLLVRLSLIHI